MTDVTLSCQGGLNIRAHRIVLSTFSPYFRAIFESQPFVDTPWTYPVVVMKDYGFLEVKAIIEFVYRGEVSVPRDRLASVLATARALEVSGLADLKAENFGVVAQGVNGTNESSNSSLPPVNGNNGFSCAGGGGSLTPSPALPVSGGSKRSLASVSSPNHLHPNSDPSSLFAHHSDTISSELMAKRLRGCLDGNDMNSSSAALSALSSNATSGPDSSALHSAALSLSATGSLSSLDGVRSLLQQPQRLPSSALNQLVQQHRQQQLLQHLALQTQRSSPTATQGNPVTQRNASLQQMMQKAVPTAAHLNQNQGRERLHAARQLQLQSNSMKQQILQQQLMRSKNLQSNVGFVRQTHVTHPFAQFQQRIRQQIQEKQRNPLQNRHLLPKSLKERVKLETAVLHDEDDEVEVMVKEKDSGDKENGRLRNEDHEDGNEESSDRQVKSEELGGEDQEEQQLVVREDEENQNQNEEEEDMEHEDEEYEIEIDKDAIFQQQQQLRLQQIQKQQHSYQMQLQLEQEEQEQRLLDYHQTLSQTGNTSEDNENEDGNGSGFGFDWQEGFTDDLPYPGQKMGDSLIKSHHLQSASINSNTNGSKNSTPLQTPDFLQPRGRKYLAPETNDPDSPVPYSYAAGRPRKGNKAQEISPCPECNKVFVRPDVLKLHYRSVHLNERHPCNLCPKIFKWPGDLSKHKRTKHPDKHPPANQNTSLHVQ